MISKRVFNPKHLLGYWKLNGGREDGKALDYSGNGNHGIMYGADNYDVNPQGKQVKIFDGSTNYINTQIASNSLTELTYVLALKPTTNVINQRLIWRRNGNSTRGGLTRQSDGFIKLQNLGSLYGTGYDSSDTSRWHYLVVTLKGSDWKMYSEEGLVDSGTASFGIPSSDEIYLASIGATATDFYTGQLSNIMIYDIALTSTEAAEVIQSIKTPLEFSPKMSPSLKGNGIPYMDLGITDVSSWNSFYLECDICLPEFGAIGSRIFSLKYSGGDDIRLWTTTTDLFFSLDDGSVNTIQIPYTAGDVVNLKCALNGSSMSVSVNNQTPIGGVGSFDFANADGATAIWSSSGGGNKTKARIYNLKFGESPDKLTMDLKPQEDGSMINILNNKSFSNSFSKGVLEYIQEPINLSEDSLVFSTRDGVKDLTKKTQITNLGLVVGKEIICDGTHYLNCGDKSYYDFITKDQSFTIAAVVKSDTLDSTYRRVLGKNNGSVSYPSDGYLLGFGGTPVANKIGFSLIKEGSRLDVASNTNGTHVGQFVHIIITFDKATNLLTMYINGSVNSSSVIGFALGSNTDLWVGGNSSSRFKGIIKSIRLFNEKKSAEWAKQDYLKEVRYW